MFSFLTYQIFRKLSNGVEATGKLGPEITAYRKNMSVTDITLDQRCTIEDALEFENLLGIIKEDEEKFFDRVTVELQKLAMKTFGFPDKGYCEWNIESMLERDVNITTKYENVAAVFLTGVPQGSTLSVHIANLIMWLKHKIMRADFTDPAKKRGNPYRIQVWDRGRETRLLRYSTSYCDDNDASHGAKSIKDLYCQIVNAVHMTGYFSLVTKLGRSAKKSMIHLYNLDPRHASTIRHWKFVSYAWSFEKGAIIEETMPFRAQFLHKVEWMENINEANTLALAVFEKQHCVVKSLGVRMRSDLPDSSVTGSSKCEQILCRLRELSLRNIDDKALAIIINSLVVSLAQFAALEATLSTTDCTRIDKAIAEKVRRGYGLTASDMKEVISLPPRQLGMGIRSFTGTILSAKARELECGLNGSTPYCAALRARWQAWAIRKDNCTNYNNCLYSEKGLIESNVLMLARYGIYLRDHRYQLCNVIVDMIAMDILNGELPSPTKKGYSGPLGDSRFRSKRSGGALGDGDASLLDFATFSPLFNEIRRHLEVCERDRFTCYDWMYAESWDFPKRRLKKFGLDHRLLANYAERAIAQIRQDAITL